MTSTMADDNRPLHPPPWLFGITGIPYGVGGSFAVVTEWKAQVDLATGVPVIKKEAVKSEKKVAHS